MHSVLDRHLRCVEASALGRIVVVHLKLILFIIIKIFKIIRAQMT
jgi:hypothetical protein